MKKIIPFTSFICLMLYACGETQSVKKNVVSNREKLIYDTAKIAILPFDSVAMWIFGKSDAIQLNNDDLKLIDTLLNACIHKNEYIDLHKYRLQYLAVIDSTGDRKVYVNGFCGFGFPVDFSEWKKQLLIVNDGGNCFFHVTINLSKKEYEELMVNGVA